MGPNLGGSLVEGRPGGRLYPAVLTGQLLKEQLDYLVCACGSQNASGDPLPATRKRFLLFSRSGGAGPRFIHQAMGHRVQTGGAGGADTLNLLAPGSFHNTSPSSSAL